jgi:DNA-binding phage protein
MLALRDISKAFGGVQEVARQAELNAHTMYRTLSEQGNPELKTLSATLKAMGMRLAIQPLSHA